MSLTRSILERASTSSLRAPAPEGEVLDRILECGLRAPDHGRLRPWRFILVRDAALPILADVAVRALRQRDQEASEALLETQRRKMLRAPLIIGVVARISRGHKIPEHEQVMSAAASSMNLLNAIHAEGFAGIWITGANCYDPVVQQALGVAPPDQLIGFLFVGTANGAGHVVSRPSLVDHVTEWTGVSAGPVSV